MRSQSEVARLRQQIEQECQAMQRAMDDFAEVGKHEFITHRYSAIGHCQQQLEPLVGTEQAQQMVIEAYVKVME